MTLGGPHVWVRRTTVPPDAHRVLAMLFNNHWHTNFVGDEHGVMEFQFDLVWRENLPDVGSVQALADSLSGEPMVLNNGSGIDDSFILQRLFQP